MSVWVLRPDWHLVQVLLLDEITVDLDVLGRSDLFNFLREECEERNVTIVYVSIPHRPFPALPFLLHVGCVCVCFCMCVMLVVRVQQLTILLSSASRLAMQSHSEAGSRLLFTRSLVSAGEPLSLCKNLTKMCCSMLVEASQLMR